MSKEKDREIEQLKQEKQNTGEEKSTREFLETLSKDQVVELCLQYLIDVEITEKQLEQANEIINNPNTLIAQQQELIESLNKQLGEKDARIADLEDKDWFEANIKQLEEQNDRLISKLEEKDKEIESLTNRTNRYENMFRSRIYRTGDMQKDIELYVKQLAIQELEKVKNG